MAGGRARPCACSHGAASAPVRRPLGREPRRPPRGSDLQGFGGRLRNELLAVEAFSTLLEAQVLVEDWRIEYNTLRPTAPSTT